LSAVAAGRFIAIGASRHQADGRVLQQVKQNAEGVEGLTYSADAIARALVGLPAAAPALPPLVSAAPQAPPPKQRAPREDTMDYGLKAGVHLPFAPRSRYYSAVSFQFNGRLQFPRFFLEFGAGFVIPTVIDDNDDYDSQCGYDSSGQNYTCTGPKTTNRGYIGGITTELGASYYLTNTHVSPYIGGGLIPRVVLAGLDNTDKRDIASMAAYAQFGITVPRHATTRFFCDLRVAQAILPQHLNNQRRVWPTEPSLHVGLGW
jgi:hypothetical protein